MANYSNLPFGCTPAVLHRYLDRPIQSGDCQECEESTDIYCSDPTCEKWICEDHAVDAGRDYVCKGCAVKRGIRAPEGEEAA